MTYNLNTAVLSNPVDFPNPFPITVMDILDYIYYFYNAKTMCGITYETLLGVLLDKK